MRKPVTVWYGGRCADDRDPRRIESDLLFGLAQRRGGGASIIRFDPPAGKADLPGMIAQMVGAPGEQESGPGGTVDQPDQDGGRRRLGAGPAFVAGHRARARSATRVPPGQPVGHLVASQHAGALPRLSARPSGLIEREEHALTPHSKALRAAVPPLLPTLDQLVVDRPREPRLEAGAHLDIGHRPRIGRLTLGPAQAQRMLRPQRQPLIELVRTRSVWSVPAPSAASSTATKGASSTSTRPRSTGVTSQKLPSASRRSTEENSLTSSMRWIGEPWYSQVPSCRIRRPSQRGAAAAAGGHGLVLARRPSGG